MSTSSWCIDRRILAAALLMTVLLATFHLRGELVGGPGTAHLLLVALREGISAVLLTLLAGWLAARARWMGVLLPAAGLLFAAGAWLYLTYVANRGDFPRPGEILASGEGGTYLQASWRQQLAWTDALLVLCGLGWGLCLAWRAVHAPRWRHLVAACAAQIAGWVAICAYVGHPPWQYDRMGCFRQFGAVPLAVADAVVLAGAGGGGSGADPAWAAPSVPLGGGGLRRIILVQVESLDLTAVRDPRFAALAAPWLSGLAVGGGAGGKPSRLFPLLAQHGAGGSADCEYAAWCGRPPAAALPWWRTIDAAGGREALPWRLAAAGVACVTMHGNLPGFFQRGRLHEQVLGFASHLDQDELGLGRTRWGSPDAAFLEAAAGRIGALPADGAWVAHLITFSSHSPFTWVDEYEVADEVRRRWALIDAQDGLSGRVRAYLRSLAYVDHALGLVVPGLASRCDLLLLYGDHPSGLIGRDYSDGSAIQAANRIELTPLVAVGTTPWPAGELATHLDIHATLADALLPAGSPVPTLGRSLLRNPAGPVPVLDAAGRERLVRRLNR